jgi:dephospho-CoA kinase
LKTLNGLVHPRVAEDYSRWAESHPDSPYLIREAALLYEAGSYTSVDKMIVVTAPEDVRIKRITFRDPHRTPEDIKAIMKNQWPEEEKVKRADFIIHNDDLHMVIPQVLQLHHQFTA